MMYKVDLRDVYEWSVLIEANSEEEVQKKAQEVLEHHRQEFKKYMEQYPTLKENDKTNDKD